MNVGDLVTASHWNGVLAMVVNTGRLTTTGIVRILITVSGHTCEVDQLAQDLEVINE